MGGGNEGFDAFHDVYGWLGFVGGIMFPLATGAQVWKVLVTKSARDISYGWEAMYFLAETLYIIYAVHFKLWPLAIPIAVEIVIMSVLVMLKVYFDNFGPKSIRRIANQAAIDMRQQPRSVTEVNVVRKRNDKRIEEQPSTLPQNGDLPQIEV